MTPHFFLRTVCGQGAAKRPMRGLTLLVAVILTSVLLSVTLSLLDITYKQVLLASSARQSQYAFYTADSLMECALYWDQQKAAFAYTASAYLTNGIICNNQTIVPTTAPNTSVVVSPIRTTIIYIPCAGGGTQGVVSVYKNKNGPTSIYATGYSSCDASDPRRIERGLKITY